MKRKVVTAILIYLIFGWSLNIYTDLRGYNHGLFLYVDMLFPFGDLSFMRSSDFLLYNLPDGLWMLSLTMFLLLIWGKEASKSLYKWLLLCFALGVGLEFLQLATFIQGTFDWMDVITYVVVFFITIFILLISQIDLWKIGKNI